MCIERFSMRLVKVKTHKSQRPKRAELIPVSLAWSMPKSIVTPAWTGSYSIAGLPPAPPPPHPHPTTPLAVCRRYPFIHLSEERQSGVKLLVYWETARRARREPWNSRPGIWGVNRSATHASAFTWRYFGRIGVPKQYDGPCWWAKPILWELNSFLM